ncbi:MAG: hypothetical protein E6J14_09260 [Chloroflexi bacterium]|nr:MAG: hypothetical protein E6J14_09260 [Chloroflexota bacterium]
MANPSDAARDFTRYLEGLDADAAELDRFNAAMVEGLHPTNRPSSPRFREAARALWRLMDALPAKHGGSLVTFLTGCPREDEGALTDARVTRWVGIQTALFDITSYQDDDTRAALLHASSVAEERFILRFLELVDELTTIVAVAFYSWTDENAINDSRLLNFQRPTA